MLILIKLISLLLKRFEQNKKNEFIQYLRSEKVDHPNLLQTNNERKDYVNKIVISSFLNYIIIRSKLQPRLRHLSGTHFMPCKLL